MRYESFQAVSLKYALSLGLSEQSPLPDWEAGLKMLLNGRRKAIEEAKGPSFKVKAQREFAECDEAFQLVCQLNLIGKLRRCIQEDKLEMFEWELKKPENQASLPRENQAQYADYLDVKHEARKRWPTICFPATEPAAPVLPAAPPPPPPASPVLPHPAPPPAPVPPYAAPPPTPIPRVAEPTRPPRAMGADAVPRKDLLVPLLRRQLLAKLEFGESRGGSRASRGKDPARASSGLPIRTFQDLFNHDHPPVAVLRRAKSFFKEIAGVENDREPEQEVAYLLYWVAILVARVRCGVVITQHSDAALVLAIRWALNQNWLDERTQRLFAVALDVVGRKVPH